MRTGVSLRPAQVEVDPVDVSPDLKAFTDLLARAVLHAPLEGFQGGGDRCCRLGRQAVGQFQGIEERQIHALAGEGRHGVRGIADHGETRARLPPVVRRHDGEGPTLELTFDLRQHRHHFGRPVAVSGGDGFEDGLAVVEHEALRYGPVLGNLYRVVEKD